MASSTEKTLGTTFTVVLALGVAADLLPSKGGVGMPSPRRFVAASLLWSLMGVIASTSQAAGRYAAKLAWAVVLATLVLGNAGRVMSALFSGAAATATAGSPEMTTTAPVTHSSTAPATRGRGTP